MRKLILLLLALPLFTSLCEAQIVMLRFKNEKVAKRYKKHTREVGGEMVILGEPVPDGGIKISARGINFSGGNQGQNELFVLNAKDPEAVPYKIKDGVKEATKSKFVARVVGSDIGSLSMYMRGEDLSTLANEHRYRRHRIEAHEVARAAAEKGTKDWFAAHRMLVLECRRLHSWLEQNTFYEAAKTLEKRLNKELKAAKEDAVEARAQRALNSAKAVDTPQNLVELAKEITGGTAQYSVMESQHVRLIYFQKLPHARAKACLELAETMIEGFRVQCVDQYAKDELADQIPDGLFLELMWVPDNVQQHHRFLQQYYGLQLSEKDKKRASSGRSFVRGTAPKKVFCFRMGDTSDPEGTTAHTTGHAIAGHHFANGPSLNMSWLDEGMAYYLSFEYTGRNSVVCKSFDEGNYIRPEGKETEREWYGLRDVFHGTALEKGRRLDRLALLKLFELEDGDIAKAWSVIDWVTNELGVDGQKWLRAGAEAARNRGKFIATWRQVSQDLFGVEASKNVYAVLEERWRAYAERFRDRATGDGHRRKR